MDTLPDLLQPIPGPNPSGQDGRYTGLYDQIKEARRQDLDLPQGHWRQELKTADWGEVIELCSGALSTTTKDLQIAAWLTEALLHRRGVSGLTEGLNLLRGLIDQFWPTVYPRSQDDELEFRAGPLEWVGSRLGEAVNSLPLPPAGVGRFEVNSCLAALGELETVCDARFGEVPPRFDALRTSLQSVQATLKPLARIPGTAFEPAAAAAAADRAAEPTNSAPPLDDVHFTITAPSAIYPASSVLLTLWVHLELQRAAVMERARQQYRTNDPADILSVSKGPVRIARGAIFSVRLEVSGARIEDPEDTLLWAREIACTNFVVSLPSNPENKNLPGKAVVYWNGIQFAKIQFVLQVGTVSADGTIPTTEKRMRKAFASYATADRDEVLGRLQGISKVAPFLDIFFDVASLRSGQDWAGEIQRMIAASDVFYLFWSLNARGSVWVEKEWRAALGTGRPDFIDPVPLQSPEEAPPPPELASLHFNDWMLAFQRRTLVRHNSRGH